MIDRNAYLKMDECETQLLIMLTSSFFLEVCIFGSFEVGDDTLSNNVMISDTRSLRRTDFKLGLQPMKHELEYRLVVGIVEHVLHIHHGPSFLSRALLTAGLCTRCTLWGLL